MDVDPSTTKRRSMLIPPGMLSNNLVRPTQTGAEDTVNTQGHQGSLIGGMRRTQSIRANPGHSRQPSVPSAQPASAVPRRANSIRPPRPVSMIASLPSARAPSTGFPSSTSRLQPSSAQPTGVDLSIVEETAGSSRLNGTRNGLPQSNGPELRRVPNSISRHVRTQSNYSVQTDASDLNVSPPASSPKKPHMPLQGPLTRPTSMRPAFSTHQQHFSPKKNTAPKPASMTIVNASTKPAGPGEVTPEIQIIQTQLLQLELLHQAFHESLTSWKASAAKKLRKRFDDTALKTERMGHLERQVQMQTNVAALREWGVNIDEEDVGSAAADEYLQILSNVVTEATRLTAPNGPIDHVMMSAHRWMIEVEQVWTMRKGDSNISLDSSYGRTATPALFIDSTISSWASDVTSLQRRLVALQNDFALLPPALENSSLARVKNGFHESIRLVRENLQVLTDAQRMMNEAEQVWIDEYAAALISV